MPSSLLRDDADHKVGYAELFFDLVFVFAITQVSHLLLYHYDLAGAIETAVIFLAIWWVWIYTTWVLNRLDPDRGAVRGLLFAMMGGGLFLSMAIPTAFDSRGLVFAVALVAMQLGRTLFTYWVGRDNPLIRNTYRLIGIWLAASGVLWIAGGFASPELRIWFWIAALLVEYAGPATGFWVPGVGRDVSTNWTVKGAHMAERCGLFVIICLGETLLVSGATFAELEWTAPGLAAFLAALAGTVGMWWVYFHIGHRRATHQIETSENPGQLARLAFTYAHIPIVAGVILGAVASERAIAHPSDVGVWAEGLTAMGGVAMFLVGNGWFKAISGGNFPLSHMVGIGLCALLFWFGPSNTLLALNAGAAVILLMVAVWEHRSVGRASGQGLSAH